MNIPALRAFKPTAMAALFKRGMTGHDALSSHPAAHPEAHPPAQAHYSPQPRKPVRPRSRQTLLEAVEPRVLLSADLYVGGGDQAQDISVRRVDVGGAAYVQVIDNASHSVIVQGLMGDTGAVRLSGSTASDRIVVDLQSGLTVPVFFDDASSADDDHLLVLQDAAQWQITGAGAGHVGDPGSGGVQFTGVENIHGAADNEDRFSFEASGSIAGITDGGAAGNDSLVLSSGVFSLVSYTSWGPEVGTVGRDLDVITFMGLEPAADLTAGAKLVTDAFGASKIQLRSQPDATAARPVIVTGDTFPESFIFADPTSITIDAGTGDDFITVTGALADLPSFSILGGSGNDEFLLDTPALSADFSLDGGADQDTLRYATTLASGLTLSDVALTRGGASAALLSMERAVLQAPLVNSVAFSGQVIAAAGLPAWASVGPGPLTGGQVSGLADNAVAGAIQEVALHPFDLSSLFIGTVGGGVWRNSDISVLFETDQAVLTPVAQARLVAFASFLKDNLSLTVQVIGHTDDSGDQVTVNQPLSETRATAVRDFLVGEGVDIGRLTASGQGELVPIDVNDGAAGSARNRRVELVVNHWVPLTDNFPSLSISALAISPRDADGNLVTAATPSNKLVIFAGTGSVSSASNVLSGPGSPSAVGIMKSLDGGTTWTLLPTLAGGTILSIQVLNNGDMLIATDGSNASGNGLFRSVDGGVTLIDVAAASAAFPTDTLDNDNDGSPDEADEAFPAGVTVSDLVLDPSNPLRVYAAVPRQGVLISEDGGQSWNPVNTGMVDVDRARRIMLTISPSTDTANHRIYAATIGAAQPLTAVSNAGTLALTVAANTVLEAGDTVLLMDARKDGIDNDNNGAIDDAPEDALREHWVVVSVAAVAGGNRVVTLTPANADKVDNNRDGSVDEAAEKANAAQGLFNNWGVGATVVTLKGNQHRLAGIFFSDDLGANWTAMPIPSTVEAGSATGIHPGAQGNRHFSMAVNPLDKTVLYVGGDRQPNTSSSSGAKDFTGRLFQGDADTGLWTAITDNGANGTAPHADSRELLFRGLHALEVDDGGIVQLRNVGTPAQAWESLNHDLSLNEFYSVAYDPVNDVILGGMQDTGSALQSAEGSLTWNSVALGDGTFVDFTGTDAVFAGQNLGNLTFESVAILAAIPGAAAAVQSVIIVPAGTNVQAQDIVLVGGLGAFVTGVIANPSGVPAGSLQVTVDRSIATAIASGTVMRVIAPLTTVGGITNKQFVTPFTVNEVLPTALLIGTSTVYESTTLGRTTTALLTTTGSGANLIGEVNSLIYGGREAGTDKATVIWVGTDHNVNSPAALDAHPLWLRNSASAVNDPLSPVTSFTSEVGTAVRDIAVDPQDWRKVFVLDTAGQVWFSPNAGQTAVFTGPGGPNTVFWKELTGNLSSIPGARLLQQLAVRDDGGTFTVLVGGQGGVFRQINGGAWHLFGTGLPNALVTSLEVVPGADDLVLAGTFGRGAWVLSDASQSISVAPTLDLRGTAGDDVFMLKRNAAQPWMLDITQFLDGEAQPATASFSVPYLSLGAITIDGKAGDDRFVIDASVGAVSDMPTTVTITGGGGANDRLEFVAPLDPNATIFDSGVIGSVAVGKQLLMVVDVFDMAGSQQVSWTGMEAVDDATLVVNMEPEVVGAGLEVLADAFGSLLGRAVADAALPGIDSSALVGALNGLMVQSVRGKDEAFVSVSRLPEAEFVQVDGGSSVLLRILEAGGLSLGDITSGAFADAAALELAFEMLDGLDNNSASLDSTTDQAWDNDGNADLLFSLTLEDVVLEGLLDLDILANVLGGGKLALTGLMDVEMTLDLSLAFGVDSKGFFIRSAGPLSPELSVTNLSITGQALGAGELGFLGVDLLSASLDMDDGAAFVFTLSDPGMGLDADNLIRASELTDPADPSALFALAAVTDGDAVADLVFKAQLGVSAVLPGITNGIALGQAGIDITWANATVPDQVTLAAGLTPGADVAHFLRFLEINGDDLVGRLEAFRDKIDAAFGAEVPYLSDKLTQLVDLVDEFQTKVLDPLMGGVGGTVNVPSIQAMIRTLATSLGVAAESFGLAYDPGSSELTYALEISRELVNVTKNLGAGLDIAGGLADLQFSSTAQVSATVSLASRFGVDVASAAAGDNPLDWFFLRDTHATASLDITATDIQATARFGFLSIGIDEGTLSTPSPLVFEVSLVDPGTNTADGRVDLREITDNLGNLGSLLDFQATGSLHLELPVTAPFLGLPAIPPGGNPAQTITIDVPDFSDPDTVSVVLGADLQDLGNFRNIDAASIVGLLGQLTGWLDQFRNSSTFKNFDVPLIGPALDNVLGFADSFRDKLLYDDKDDGNDTSKTLLFDINQAIGNSSLAGRIRAEFNAAHELRLIANDASVLFTSVSGGLGFDGGETAVNAVFDHITANAAMGVFKLPADAVLTIALNGAAGVALTILKTDTDANTAFGNDVARLVGADNAATFDTADEMVLKLTEILNIADLLEYDPADDTLSFNFNLADTFGQIDLPIDFELEGLPEFLTLETNGVVRLKASGDFNFTLGVYLGDAPASAELQDSDLLADVNGGVDTDVALTATGAADVRTVHGQLGTDAVFQLSVDGAAAVAVTVTKANSLNNATALDLVADLNAALLAAGLSASVLAVADGQSMVLRGQGAVTTLDLTAGATNAAVKDMGFAASQASEVVGGVVTLKASNPLAPLRGRLSADASFSIALGAAAPVVINLAAASTQTNRFLFDVVADLQTAIDATALVGQVEVGLTGGRLNFAAVGAAAHASSLVVTAAVGSIAALELGLGTTATANRDNLVITLRNGQRHGVSLFGLTTLGQAKAALDAVPGLEVSVNARGVGLNIKDTSTGATEFKVELANQSSAAIDLGLLRADAQEGESPDGLIEGADIGGLTPLDRFYIENTNASITLQLSTPQVNALGQDQDTDGDLDLDDGVSGSAGFGFVGVHLDGGGTLSATLGLELTDPGTTLADGRISFTELLGALDDLGSLVAAPTLTGGGTIALDLSLTPALTGLDLGVNPQIVLNVVSLGNPFTGEAPDIEFSFPDLGDLLSFDNLDLSFASIVDGLQALADFLGEFEAFGFLGEPLPIINLSVNDLISVADRFAAAVDDAQGNPAGTVQLLEDKLKEAFGIAQASNLIDLVLQTDNMGTPLDDSDDINILRVNLELALGFDESLAVDLDLAALLDLPDALSLGGAANLAASGSITLQLDFGFDVSSPLDIYIFNSTGIAAEISASGNDLSFRAALGPAGIFVQDGMAMIEAHATLGIDQDLFDEQPHVAAGGDNDRVLVGTLLSNLGSLGFTVAPTGSASAVLPVYFPTESIYAGDITLAWPDLFDIGSLTLDVPPDLLSIDPSDFSVLDQLLLAVDGVDFFLEGLQDILDGEIAGVTLPLIGDKLAGAADVIGDFRGGFIEDFRTAVQDLANPVSAFNAGGVNGPDVPGAADPISEMLFELLGPGGLGLLLDSDDAGFDVSVADIKYLSNISVAGLDPADIFLDWDFKIGGDLLNVGAGIDFDIGIPGLGLETRGDIHLDIGWELAFGFGLNADDGFYLDIADGSELQLDVDVTIPGGGITGTLGFLQLTADDDEDDGDGKFTHLGATFGVNVKNGSKPGDDKLSFGELGQLSLEVGIAAEAVVDLGMRLALSSDLVPGAATNFPSLVADFTLEWAVGSRTPGAQTLVSLGDLDGSFLKNGLQFVGFENVGLDMGSYFSDLIGPIVAKVQEITEPIKPFLDFLTEPIPVISDLAGPTTLLDIAEMSGFLNPGIIKAIEVVDQVVDIANSLSGIGDNVILYFDDFLPSLVIYEAPEFGALSALPDLSDPNLDLGALADSLLSGPLLDWLPSEISGPLGDIAADVAASVTKMLPGGSASEGFSLPIIEDPSQIFGMLMGQEADLVKFTMAPLEVGAEFSAFFSLLGPLGVSINAEFDAQFGPFTFAYDTAGVRGFAESGFRNPLLLFDGFYVGDLIDGVDVPELQFNAGLWAAAELNLAVARGGVGGGLFADIDFDLHDPDDDGKVRIKELITNVLNEFKYGSPALSPLAVFDITGKLTAELFAFVKVDLFLFSIDERWHITDPITLLDFESNFIRVPTLATELGNGVLQLNMGKASAQRIEGDLSDFGETFVVTQKDADEVWVWSPLVDFNNSGTNDNGEAQSYKVTNAILALGGEGNDTIDLSGVTANLRFELEGNAGADVIKAGSGLGSTGRILGGAGNDELWGSGGADNIFGETGDDEIHGGAGNDWLFGDGDAKDAIVGDTITVTLKPSDGADHIYGDDGADLIIGSGGADFGEGGDGDDVLIGDSGKVSVNASRVVIKVEDTTKGAQGFKDNLKGDGGNDRIWGGKGDDKLYGGADADKIYGEHGFDTLQGDGGADQLWGGDDNDTIDGGAGNDKAWGEAGSDTIHGGADDDELRGGTGADLMHGNGGNDHLYGNAEPDKLYGDDGDDYLEGGGGNDLTLGGDGLDILVAGYGSDTLDGQAESDQYMVLARGGSVTELTTAYDSGAVGTDVLSFWGTGGDDTVLLRAMADSYFPLQSKLNNLINKIALSGEADKLTAMKQAIEDAYGPHDLPSGMRGDLTDAYYFGKDVDLAQAVEDTYDATDALAPTKADVKAKVDQIFNATNLIGSKPTSTLRALRLLYSDAGTEVPEAMLEAISAVYIELSVAPVKLTQAIGLTYQTELQTLGADTDTAFIALINNGGDFIERFNYRNMEGMAVNTLAGADYIVSDDVRAATTINAGLGDDRIQVGQVFRSERVKNPFIGGVEQLITNIRAEDIFTTLEITRGWLSNGVSVPTTINGEGGNDNFTVFHNIAPLNLNGGDGDDVFTVRAFALQGSTDSERARTDMKGDAGADTILYAKNAPVGIDGGDGFDTVRIVGTEFSDDFVITDGGVFGAGLNVTYVNIEKLVADGAEGDDRYFVLSTGLDVVTEIDGGLGSDTFFVGGNPSRSPISVASNDLRGHSGIILHSVESSLGGSAWNGLPVEGLSANVGDGSEDMVIVTEQGGRSSVLEGMVYAAGAAGLAFDSYSVRLTRAPNAGTSVSINVVPAAPTPEDIFKYFSDLEFLLPGADPTQAASWVDFKLLPALEFTAANWDDTQDVVFRGKNDAALEGLRTIFINHVLSNSSDPEYAEAQMLSVKVFMDDDDQRGVVVRPTGSGNTVLEGGFDDAFTVSLTHMPSADVTVSMTVLNADVSLGGVSTLTFTPGNWNVAQTVSLVAVSDGVREGFHTDYISFDVSSADVDQTPAPVPNPIEIDGYFTLDGVQPIPLDQATSFVFLPHRPTSAPVSVWNDGVALAPNRFTVSGSTLSFLTEAGTPEMRTGAITASYVYLERGYDKSAVRDIVVDLYDEDSPAVVIEQTAGSTDAIEDDPDAAGSSASGDTYRVRLSQAPALGETVTVKADAFLTRTSYDGTALFAEQVTVNGASITSLEFDLSNWDQWKTVTVAAINDGILDGNDTQVFAPDLQTVNKIRGPLIIDGAAGDGSLSLPAPLMMPWELNIRDSDGAVQAFTRVDGAGSTETMTVLREDLDKVVATLGEDNPDIGSIFDLIGKTLEMTKGPGLAVVLDPLRPRELFDRFWLITNVVADGLDNVILSLQNPSAVDPALFGAAGAPVASTLAQPVEYAITGLSINFFADERVQVDYLFVYDEDSVADDVGALTSFDGVVMNYTESGATSFMTVEASALTRTRDLLGLSDVSQLAGKRIDITNGPGTGRSWLIGTVGDGASTDLKVLTLTAPTGGAALPTNRSEFRIEGSDRYGRITGLGMGPNIIFSGRPQPGGITYGDLEVVQLSLGSGDDVLRIDYASHSDDHATLRELPFQTLLLVDTGAGDDDVRLNLHNGQDGQLALSLGAGDDTVTTAAGSNLGIVVFGGLGDDDISLGDGDDIAFGDIGRVDYVDANGEIITRLGDTEARLLINPPLTSASNPVGGGATLTDATANFSTDHGGLAGLMMQAISLDGSVQFRRIVSNTSTVLTLDAPWDVDFSDLADPKLGLSFYRVSVYPEDQTDGVARGPRLIWSIDETLGGADEIHGGGGADILIGGAFNDELWGDAGTDWVAGDDARFDLVPISGDDGPTQLQRFLVDPVATGDDSLYGGANADTLIGGYGADTVWGEGASDQLIGDAAVVTFAAGNQLLRIETLQDDEVRNGIDTLRGGEDKDIAVGGGEGDLIFGGAHADMLIGDAAELDFNSAGLRFVNTTARSIGGIDTIRGDAGDDVVIGGAQGDQLDGGDDEDLLFGDNLALELMAGSGDAITPRMRLLLGAVMYGANGEPQIGARVGKPGGNPDWADWHITLDQSDDETQFGADNMAGGAQDDMLFGQRGDDTLQGDGSIDIDVTDGNSVESLATDGDDYIEGNAGADILFGNLGQDDLIGGTSTLFSLGGTDKVALRDDGADLIFGGAGTDLARNNLGDLSHGRDADMVLGDNGNIYRLLGTVTTPAGSSSVYLGFNYDNSYVDAGDVALRVRAAELKDYTPGGTDFVPSSVDHGAADIIHGESGDDFIYGMSGNDVIFGEGQDDDLYGGWGHDWISGGTGDDGVLGDDGRIFTSRNGTPEPLYGLAASLQLLITTPGNVQSALTNPTGALNKAVDLTPFNLDPADADMLFDPSRADDLIYGGWGNDFLHGGAGDDGISGAEALPELYATPLNTGGSLGYSALRGEFALYDEYAPMTRIDVPSFVLNFSAAETGQPLDLWATTAKKPTDGDDKIFGDLGNDWLVGGTGRDNLYGGWGDDLLNADDDQGTGATPNTTPDTHASYEDRAYGGAGRDVLIGNTGGDRLIDWVGEFNSYLVPFAPFGNATVSRTLQPQLAEFLYALSKADGADQTRGSDGDLRNGEPIGELGLVRQQDFAWQTQTGAPADPQAGNVPGGKRDVLRGATFNDGALQALAPDSGSWQVSGGALQVASASNKADAVAVYQVGDALPSYFEVLATIKVIKPTAGWDANSYVVFDYRSPTDFKYAGLDVATNKLIMGQRTAAGWTVLKQAAFTGGIKSDTWYNVMLSVNGLNATLIVNNKTAFSHTFAATVVDGYAYGLNWGLVGFGSNKSRGAMDNIAVQVVPPAATVTRSEDFSAGLGALLSGVAGSSTGNWQATGGRLVATPSAGAEAAVQLLNLSGVTRVAGTSLLELSATLNTAGRAGIVFDRYSATDFKFAAIDVQTQQVLIGHRSSQGWVIDAALSKALVAGADYKLGISIRGSSVSVTLNDQAAVGFVYNAVGVDGRFGLFSKSGAASFDTLSVKTNDAAVPVSLMAEGLRTAQAETGADAAAAAAATAWAETAVRRVTSHPVGAATALTDAQIELVAAEARARWVQAGASAEALARLQITRSDLPGAELAQYLDGQINLDLDAAGLGWFADASPADDAEFVRNGAASLQARPGSLAAGRMDLLSVLSHEMGHALGLGHADGGVMDEALRVGERSVPPAMQQDMGIDQGAFSSAALIDWKAQTPAASVNPARGAGAAALRPDRAWQARWVGQDGWASAVNPNAGMRLHATPNPGLDSMPKLHTA